MVYDESNKTVLVENRADKKWPGIAFPGGHVEAGESFTDAVVREVLEETGINIYEPRLCGIKNWIKDSGERYVVHLYKTSKFCGEIKSSDEGAVEWIPLDEIFDAPLASGMDSTLKLFFDESLSEQFLIKKNREWIREMRL